MIDFTIKTLDSNDHSFSVDDEITVEQLKDKVKEQMGIETNLQRLIFCGRVLQDEKKLADYNVDGKVIHMVQRPPPGYENRPPYTGGSGSSSSAGGSANQRRYRIRPGTDRPSTSASGQAPRVVDSIHQELRRIVENSAEPASSEVPLGTMNNENSQGATLEENDDDDDDDEQPDEQLHRHPPRRSSIGRPSRSLRIRYVQPRHLADLIDQLQSLHEQFLPFQSRYARLLRAGSDPEPAHYSEAERELHQRCVDLISETMHNFAHAYHSLSDITFSVGSQTLRLSAEPIITRQLIPMQAHINVVPNRTRPPPPPPPPRPTTATATSAASAGGGAATFSPTATATNESGGDTRENQTPGNTVPQPNVNISSQPDPVSQQAVVDTIFTAIARELGNVINGLPQTDQSPPQTQPQPAESQAPRAHLICPHQSHHDYQQSQTRGQANQRQGQAGQAGQAEFDNTFRNMGPTIGGVELVMSMEEVPQNLLLGNLSNYLSNSISEQQLNQLDGGVFFAPMAFGNPPNMELLQSIMSTVTRQGNLTGVEGVAMPIPNSLATQIQNMIQSQAQPLARSQDHTQELMPPMSAVLRPVRTQEAGPGQAAESPAGDHQASQNNGQPRQPTAILRRATGSRSARDLIQSLVFDRILNCDSHHARRFTQRRREQHQHLMEQQERNRSDRLASQNFETLRHRRLDISARHISTIVHLLNSQPSHESWFNAAMVAVSRQLYMSDLLHPSGHEQALIPHEFLMLRLLLRNYMHVLIVRAGNNETDEAFESVADFLLEQYADFIGSMGSMAPIRTDVDPMESIRALVRSRLPAVIACVMSDSASESFVARFYALFLRIFTEMCTLITYMCDNDEIGMRYIFRLFLNEVTSDFDEPIRDTMVALSMDNLAGLLGSLTSNTDSIMRFVRCPGGESSDDDQEDESQPEPTPMDVPVEEQAEEPPQQEEATVVEASAPPESPQPEPEPQAQAASASAVPSSSAQPAPATVVIGLPESSPSRPSSSSTQSESSSPTSDSSSDQNNRFRPIIILQQWGDEWVPVITRDMQTQRSEPAEPYSDAYLSGMPSRKRRCVRQARPPTTLDGFMNESIREASERTTAPDSSSIRVAFREHMRGLARQRATTSEDFDPRHPAARFINPPKPNQSELENEDTESGV